MTAVQTVTRILHTKVLSPPLTIIPARGATEAEICDEESLLRQALRPQHVALLQRWNGIGLEVVRLFGCGANAGEVGRLAEFQVRPALCVDGALVIGASAAGFAFVQGADGQIHAFDTLNRAVQLVAADLDDFISRLVFGRDAASFGGQDWLDALRHAGIVR